MVYQTRHGASTLAGYRKPLPVKREGCRNPSYAYGKRGEAGCSSFFLSTFFFSTELKIIAKPPKIWPSIGNQARVTSFVTAGRRQTTTACNDNRAEKGFFLSIGI